MERIGPYRILGEIAHGAMGLIYRARDEALERDVAIKVLLHHVGELQRFREEARAAARLRHPGIVAVHTAGLANGRPYLVLDLVDGPSLARRVHERGPLPQREAARIAAEVARALHYAHREGVIHRDVKPANILIAKQQPYLTDFGLAKQVGGPQGLTETGEILGTPGYMAPEQANGEPASPRTDVYGLGATLYHLLTGRPPFQGGAVIDTINQVLTQDPTPPRQHRPELDPDLEGIVLKCLARAPSDRYLDAAVIAVELEAWLAGQASTEAQLAERRGRGALIGLTVALLLLLGVALALGARLHAAEAELSDLRGAAPTPAPSPPPAAPDPAPPLDPEAARAIAKGDALRAERSWRQALAAYGRALELQPGSTPALVGRGQAWLRLHRGREAVADLQAAVDADPELPSAAWAALARAYQIDGRAPLGLEALDGVLWRRPHDATLLTTRGELLLEDGGWALAARALGLALRAKRDTTLLLLRGQARDRLGDLERARSDLTAFLRDHPEHPLAPQARMVLGGFSPTTQAALAHYERGTIGPSRYALTCRLRRARLLSSAIPQPRQALEHYRRYLLTTSELDLQLPAVQAEAAVLARRLEQDEVEPALAQAFAHLQRADPAGALASITPLLERQPTHVRLLDMRARITFTQNDLKASATSLALALKHAPGNPRLRAQHAQRVAMLGRQSEGLAELEAALAESPQHPQLLFARAAILSSLPDRGDEALATLEELLQVDPEHAHGFALRAFVLEQEQRLHAAGWNLTRAIRLEPNPSFLLRRGQVLTKLSQHSAAQLDFEQVLNVTPGDPAAVLALADCYWAQGKLAEAEAEYRNYRELTPGAQDLPRVRQRLSGK